MPLFKGVASSVSLKLAVIKLVTNVLPQNEQMLNFSTFMSEVVGQNDVISDVFTEVKNKRALRFSALSVIIYFSFQKAFSLDASKC